MKQDTAIEMGAPECLRSRVALPHSAPGFESSARATAPPGAREMVLPGCSFMGTLAQNGEGLEASPASLVPSVCQGSWLGGCLPQKPAESVAHPLISGPGRWLLTLPRTWVLCQPGRAISARVSSKSLGQRLAVQEALSCLLMGWAALTAPQGLNKAGIVPGSPLFPTPRPGLPFSLPCGPGW